MSALLLIFWGAWIIGIQSYVLVSYTQKFHDDFYLPGVTTAGDLKADEAWGNAYNGMSLAAASMAMLTGLYALVAIPERTAVL